MLDREHQRWRLPVVVSMAAIAVLFTAGTADAHVTVHPETAAAGSSDGVLTFRVPDEDDTAATTKVEVLFPTGHPIASVLVAPEPGWTAKVTTTRLATPIHTDDGDVSQVVSQVTWTGGRIAPGRYQDFDIAYGQLPDGPGPLVFKALQTYSNGKVVRWIDSSRPGAAEPAHPAPVLRLTSGSDNSVAVNTRQPGSAAPRSHSDSTARYLAGAALVLAVIAVLIAGLGRVRGRR